MYKDWFHRDETFARFRHDFFNGPLVCAAIMLVAASGCQESSSPVVPTRPTPSNVAASAASDTPTGQHPVARTEVRDTTFDDVKFDMKKEEPFERLMLTDAINQLDGQKIRIRGYIFPTPIQNSITEFVLVRDNMECCFGPGAALYDCILVKMSPGKTTDYVLRPVTVEGTFTVQELRGPDGRHLVIYQIEGDAVQ